MAQEPPRPLDDAALAMFASKGTEGGPNIPQAGQSNGVKVRRVLQLTQDLSLKPLASQRLLDLGCGEGVYAIEAALAGAQVLGLDARTTRMQRGAAVAERLGLTRLQFQQRDVRAATREQLGGFDTVYLLGLLYHLDTPDVFEVLAQVAALCDRLLIIDTLICLKPDVTFEWRGQRYHGARVREHADDDPPALRASKLLKSIDNTFSVRLTRESVVRLLREVGFTSVVEAHVPLEADKAVDRITFAAVKTDPVRVATYPWVNDRTEPEIAAWLAAYATRPLLRATWAPGPPVRPLAPEHLAGEELQLALHGPGRAGLKRSHHEEIPGDPWYLWSGKCSGAWAASFHAHGRPLDLRAPARVRWRAKQSGDRRLRLILESSAGEWFVSSIGQTAAADWSEFELTPGQTAWHRLDITALSPRAIDGPVHAPPLESIRSFGVTDLEAGGDSAACSRLDWLEVYARYADVAAK